MYTWRGAHYEGLSSVLLQDAHSLLLWVVYPVAGLYLRGTALLMSSCLRRFPRTPCTGS